VSAQVGNPYRIQMNVGEAGRVSRRVSR
jgi:hypothetical protein